jgi:membrane protein DedA with SNARE-associated domain/rhodanese-related sulfurtransferase
MDRLIAEYGLAFVFANVLLEQLGLPIPAMPTLIVSGALAAEGGFSVAAVFGLAFVACMLGDAAWYLAGRLWGRRVMALLCRVSLSPDSCVRQTEFRFERWGRLTLVLSKFIPGLSTIAPPLSGAMRLGWPSFLLLNGLGVAIWAGAAIGAGMLFHAGIHQLIDRLEGLGTLALQAIGVLLAGYVALKWWERRRFYRMLRIARIGVQDLRSLIDRGARPVVVDVRSRVARETDPRYIPGALAMDIGEVDARLAELSPQSEIVFYCSCPNEATAAQVAKKLIGLGYTKVRPLHGGLDAWVAAGFEVERRG